MAKQQQVPRPTKKSEYTILFASSQAQRGWRDLSATRRSALADAWDFLTRTPLQVTPTNYPLKGALSAVVKNGTKHDRWQHKPSRGDGARIWFYVAERTVFLEQVHTHHPNETK